MLRQTPLMLLVLYSLCSFAASACAAPVAQEAVVSAGSGGYPKVWPAGPPQSSAPDWARPGLVRFARWDGGPIETAKGFLSGWPGMNPPIPDFVYTTTNWYDLSTVKLLRDAHINLIWVTFSAGFSIPTEKVQRDLLRPYTDECHRHGIHVLAYESVANMFWEEMFQNVPESKDWLLKDGNGKPVPYGAGDYTKMGRVTRYMADLSKSGWRDLLKKRIDLAIAAGMDGIMYDNVLAGPTMDTAKLFEEVMRYTLARKSDFLIMANFHRDKYILNRLLNCSTTEDGGESGIFSEENLKRCPRSGERSCMLKVENGYLVNGVGLFRTFENLSEGWKPTMIESNLREVGVREKNFMRPERQQLAIAEPMAFGNVSNELFVDLRFAHDLWRSEPAAMAAWKAIGQYYGFFADHTEYYRGARSVAPLAMVLDNRSEGQATMNGLAARSVLYNVLYEHELTPEKLKSYRAVGLLSASTMRDRALEAVKQYVTDGGRLLAWEGAASKDETGKSRPRPEWFGKKLGQGETTYAAKMPQIDELAATLLSAAGPPVARIDAPKGVLYNVTRQPDKGRLLVHVLNYLPHPVEKVVVRVDGKHEAVQLLTPDEAREPPRIVHTTDSATEIEIPRVKIYSVLVLKSRP
jgi:hypothetical protein